MKNGCKIKTILLCLAEAGGCVNMWDADLNDDTVKICPGIMKFSNTFSLNLFTNRNRIGQLKSTLTMVRRVNFRSRIKEPRTARAPRSALTTCQCV